MSQTCNRSFDEEQISGYLDHALPQVQAQRVRIHLEDCSDCRALYEQMRSLRETARSTRFQPAAEDSWPEMPHTRSGFFSRSLGWLVLVAWLLTISGYALWQFLSASANPFEIFLVLGLPGALLLLFLSVLLDRLRDLKTDRYRGVHR